MTILNLKLTPFYKSKMSKNNVQFNRNKKLKLLKPKISPKKLSNHK